MEMIAGNWKMHLNRSDAIALAKAVEARAKTSATEVVVCPTFVHLDAVRSVLSSAKLAAQNAYFENSGAFTGEIAAPMLKDLGCDYCLIGHSERRQIFGETDESVNKKLKAVLKAGMRPIFCVGETLGEREANRTFDVVARQLEKGLAGITEEIVIAYEPVWAIGTGKVATKEQAQEVHAFIRGRIPRKESRILYGGSVKPDNIGELIAMDDIDGALVGGASLQAESFTKIIDVVNYQGTRKG